MTSWSEDAFAASKACLEERGWQVTVEGGAHRIEVPEEQRDQYFQDKQECDAQFEAEFPRPVLTEDDWRRRYAYELSLVECLAKEGFDQVTEPPTEEAYVSEAMSSPMGSPSWHAYSAVGAVSTEVWEQLESACPQQDRSQ